MKSFLHWRGVKRKYVFFCVNRLYAGAKPRFFERKRKLLNSIGFELGEGTKVVGPIEWTGSFRCGKNCWLGKNMKINGNGSVIMGDNCDVAPEVTFQTGGHEIGTADRRAGAGCIFHQAVGNGVWIGGRVTILNNAHIGDGCVIAGCACVTKDVPDNLLVGGVPAKTIKVLDEHEY